MSSDPLAPITQASDDLAAAVANATAAIQAATKNILLAVRELKNPTTPTGEIGGLATSIETQAKAINQLATQLNTTTATLGSATGPVPTSITVKPNPISLDLNGAAVQQLDVVDSDNDDITADPNTQYISDTPANATVSAGGLVTGVAVGSGNINVVDEFGNKATVPFTVVNSAAAPAPQAAKKA